MHGQKKGGTGESSAGVEEIERRSEAEHASGEGEAVLSGEELQQSPHRAAGEDEADEKQDRAEWFVPAQVHEVENDEHELHGREHDERGDDEPFRERQINADDLDAGDDREEHRDLDVDLEFTALVVAVTVSGGSVCGRTHGLSRGLRVVKKEGRLRLLRGIRANRPR